MKRLLCGALFATLCLGGLAPRVARAEVIERVVAVVNEEAVFLSELRSRAVPFVPRIMEATTEDERAARFAEVYAELLNHLIDEVLIRQVARRMHVRVTNADVDMAIQNVLQSNNFSSAAEFWEAVHAQGISEREYRADLRRQLLQFKVLNQRMQGRVDISEEDIRRRYESEIGHLRRTLRFRVAHIFMAVEAEASATTIAAARANAEGIRRGLDVANFDAAMAEHGGDELGWIRQGELPAELESALLTLDEGEISAPVRGPGGFHIFLLRERQQGSSEVPSYAEARDRVYMMMRNEAAARQGRIFLQELRRDAVISRRLDTSVD